MYLCIDMSKKIKILSSEEGYDLAADIYDENENYLNSFEQGELIPLLGPVAGKKILDVGAGTGRLSLPLANREAVVTAFDISPKMLEKIKTLHFLNIPKNLIILKLPLKIFALLVKK